MHTHIIRQYLNTLRQPAAPFVFSLVGDEFRLKSFGSRNV